VEYVGRHLDSQRLRCNLFLSKAGLGGDFSSFSSSKSYIRFGL
jgi:hypothetical protein